MKVVGKVFVHLRRRTEFTRYTNLRIALAIEWREVWSLSDNHLFKLGRSRFAERPTTNVDTADSFKRDGDDILASKLVSSMS